MRHPVLPLLLACLGLVAIDTALAQQRPRPMPTPREDHPQSAAPQSETSSAQSSENDASLSDSVRWAQRVNGGRVLGAERIQSDGREINRIKMMDDAGHVSYVDDDRSPRHGNGQHNPAPPAHSHNDPPATP
jgi:hypothetical protein